ncbi:MAG: AlpA family transcriptional regulator [Nevskiales bacterium]|nr:AlpA family transcriptional regulator [Nevskiales bacterium]
MLSDRILRLPRVKDATGLSRSTIYERVRDGTFPAPVSLGKKSVGWSAAEVDAWIQRTLEAGRKQLDA